MAEPTEARDGALNPRRRRATNAIIVAFLAFQVVVPMRYYLGERGYDERFAWRMFSSTDVRACTASVEETVTVGGRDVQRPVPLQPVLHAAWIQSLQLPRPDVVEAFLRWRGEAVGAREVRYTLRCSAPDGTSLAPVDASFDGRTREFRTPEQGW